MRIAKVVFFTCCCFAATYWLTVLFLKNPTATRIFNKSEGQQKHNDLIDFSQTDVAKNRKVKIELQSFFQNLKQRYGFNGNVLIGKGAHVIYESSYGNNGFPDKTPLDTNSVFQIASLSKQFTAVAVLQLVEEEKVSLNKPFKFYFPEFPYEDVTVEMLLTHRSGLSNYMYFCDEVCDRKKPICNKDVLNLICQHKPNPYLPAGKRFDYSNTGYALLASLVEKQSGLSFSDYARKKLFEPLNMHSTLVYDKCLNQQFERKTRGFDTNGKPAEDTYLDGVTGDKGIYTTARDLFRWSVGLNQNTILSNNFIREAWKARNPELKPEENYGYGFRIRNLDQGKKVIYHAGWWHGYHALFMKLLHNDITIILLTNRVNWSIKNMDELQAILNKHYPKGA